MRIPYWILQGPCLLHSNIYYGEDGPLSLANEAKKPHRNCAPYRIKFENEYLIQGAHFSIRLNCILVEDFNLFASLARVLPIKIYRRISRTHALLKA